MTCYETGYDEAGSGDWIADLKRPGKCVRMAQILGNTKKDGTGHACRPSFVRQRITDDYFQRSTRAPSCAGPVEGGRAACDEGKTVSATPWRAPPDGTRLAPAGMACSRIVKVERFRKDANGARRSCGQFSGREFSRDKTLCDGSDPKHKRTTLMVPCDPAVAVDGFTCYTKATSRKGRMWDGVPEKGEDGKDDAEATYAKCAGDDECEGVIHMGKLSEGRSWFGPTYKQTHKTGPMFEPEPRPDYPWVRWVNIKDGRPPPTARGETEAESVNCTVADEWTRADPSPAGCKAAGTNNEFAVFERKILVHPKNNGLPCPTSRYKTMRCDGTPRYVKPPPQPVDCVLSEYSNWGKCDKKTGTQTRTRTVLTHPQNGGDRCGALKDVRSCSTKGNDCVMSKYSKWGKCDKETGTQTRTRKVQKEAEHGGNACGKTKETRECPVACKLSGFSDWSECKNGKKTKTRTVVQQRRNGGKACGSLVMTEDCVSTTATVLITIGIVLGVWTSLAVTIRLFSRKNKKISRFRPLLPPS